MPSQLRRDLEELGDEFSATELETDPEDVKVMPTPKVCVKVIVKKR